MTIDPQQDPPRFVDNGPVRIAYWDYGSGPRTVLLIMGIHMRAAHWGAHFIASLAERYRVLCFDNRGTGDSTRPVDEITAELWAADAIAVLDAAGVKRAHLLGTSMGGRVSQQIALDYPERVDHMILLSSAIGGPRHVNATERGMSSFKPQPGLSPAELRRRGLIAVTAEGFAEREPERLARLVEIGGEKSTPISVLVKQLGVANTSLEDRLANVTAPTLIIHGDSDDLVPMANGELIHRCMPRARWERLDGVGHLPAWEAPERLTELVYEFLPT